MISQNFFHVYSLPSKKRAKASEDLFPKKPRPEESSYVNLFSKDVSEASIRGPFLKRFFSMRSLRSRILWELAKTFPQPSKIKTFAPMIIAANWKNSYPCSTGKKAFLESWSVIFIAFVLQGIVNWPLGLALLYCYLACNQRPCIVYRAMRVNWLVSCNQVLVRYSPMGNHLNPRGRYSS